MQEDEEYYERFLHGDKGAMEKLVAIHRQGLTLFLYGIVRDMALAEELMIDTFAQLVISGSRYRRKASLKTYLFTIGRNLAFSYGRDRKRHEYVPLEDAESLPDPVLGGLLAQEKKRSLYEAMRKMNPEYCEILDLIYLEDMSYDEAAEVLGKNRKQVANLVFRAKQQLKEILEEEP